MKKFVLTVLVMCLVLLTGCSGEKTLVCSKDISSEFGVSGITAEQTANMKFNNNKVQDMSTTITVTLSDTYKSYIDQLVSSIGNQYDKQYGSYDHVSLKTTKKGDNQIIVDISFDYKNMTSSEKSGLSLTGSEKYSKNKKTLEKQGYSCK